MTTATGIAGPMMFEIKFCVCYVAESCSATLKLESRVVGPRDKSRFPPDKDGPKMGMGFLWR